MSNKENFEKWWMKDSSVLLKAVRMKGDIVLYEACKELAKQSWQEATRLAREENCNGELFAVEDLKKLIVEWNKEYAFLHNSDHSSDRSAGNVYNDCAKQLEALVK